MKITETLLPVSEKARGLKNKWKGLRWYKKLGYGSAGFLAGMILLGIAMPSTPTEKPGQTPTPAVVTKTETPKVETPKTQEPTMPADTGEYGTYIVHQKMGKKTSDGVDTVETSSYYNGSLALIVNAENGFTKDNTLSGINMDIKNLVPAIFKDRPEVKKVTINFEIPIVSDRGTAAYANVRFVFTRENNERINWDNIVYKNIPKIADEYSKGPYFQQ